MGIVAMINLVAKREKSVSYLTSGPCAPNKKGAP